MVEGDMATDVASPAREENCQEATSFIGHLPPGTDLNFGAFVVSPRPKSEPSDRPDFPASGNSRSAVFMILVPSTL